MELICGTTILDRVLDSCWAAANRIRDKAKADAEVVVVTPTGDPIAEAFRHRAPIIEGPEDDVLSRYMIALESRGEPDYLVRITGDCPLIPSALIINMTMMALHHQYDYFSNVDDRFRTSVDGVDCEIISNRLMRHASAVAKEPYDREHVTPIIRRAPPDWAKMGMAINHFDESHIKLSVDTPEDLEACRRAFDSAFSKYQAATRIYGRGRVHRL